MIELSEQHDHVLFHRALEVAEDKLRSLITRHPDFYPMYTVDGKWKHSGEAWTHWCDGFLPGMLWIIYSRKQSAEPDAEWWRDQAIRYSTPLEPRKLDRDVHDLGFIFMSTYYRWYNLTRDPALNAVVIEAGRTMSLRFREKGEYLRSFVSEDSIFIDIMMNVGIIFYAAIEIGDKKLMDIAMRHCLTTRRVLVRGDGSTAHEGLFDTRTGEFLRQTTHQGFRGDSCWSRGLAWALYGFATSYRYSRDPRFLQTAEACADFFLEHMPADGVPLWDFDDSGETRDLVDTSAGAIAASGLLQLQTLCGDRLKGTLYGSAARKILASLCRHYVAAGDVQWEGILKGGVYHLHKNLGVSESVMWGEYFFLEAANAAISSNYPKYRT